MAQTEEIPNRWEVLCDVLLDERVAITRQVRERFQAEWDVYRAMPAEALDPGIELGLERTLRSARAGRDAVSDAPLAEIAKVGETRALQGVPIEAVLGAWRLAIELVIDRAREIGARSDLEPLDVLDFVQSLLAWADVAMATLAAAHRTAELELARQDEKHRANLVRSVLFGTLAPAEIRRQFETYGIDPQADYVAVRARPATDGAHRLLERALGFHDAVQHRRGLSAIVDGDLAGFLRTEPTGDQPGVVGVGPPRAPDRLGESFRSATRALTTAVAFGLVGVHTIAALGSRPAILADTEVGEHLRRRYLDPLEATRSAAELVTTMREYFACDMHVERTAEALSVHQNTLRYRISRFEELTGANLRDSRVAFEVWWALDFAAGHAPRV